MQRQEDWYRRRLLTLTITLFLIGIIALGHVFYLKWVISVDEMVVAAEKILSYKTSSMDSLEIDTELDRTIIKTFIADFDYKLLSEIPKNDLNTPVEWEVQYIRELRDNPTQPYVYLAKSPDSLRRKSLLIPVRYEESCLRCHGVEESNTNTYPVYPGDFAGAVMVQSDNKSFPVREHVFIILFSTLGAVFVLIIPIGLFMGWKSGYIMLFRNIVRVNTDWKKKSNNSDSHST